MTCPFVRGIKRTAVTCAKTHAHVRKLYKPISQVRFLCSSFLTNYFLWFFPLSQGEKTKFLALWLCSLCLQPVNLAEDLQRHHYDTWVGLNEQIQLPNLQQPWFCFIFSYQLLTRELLSSLVAHDVILKKILHFPVLHYYFPTMGKLAFISVMAPITCCGMLYLELCLGEPSHQRIEELFIYWVLHSTFNK